LHTIPNPVPVPSTAIYSKTDGIVPWQICIEDEEGHGKENIEAPSSHFGFGHNRVVLVCIADRLAQPEGHWAPFKETKAFETFFD